jgi:hypothetical protein
MSFYTEARRMREDGATFEFIYTEMKRRGCGVVTHKKIREACSSLYERIRQLRSQGQTIEAIVKILALEDYTTKRGTPPLSGCVWYALNREKVLKAKSDARRL